jgi:Tfp pilus assembly protein PilE
MRAPLVVVTALLVTAAIALGGCCLCPIAASNFDRYQCRSKQTEAKANLQALAVAEESYRAEYAKYAALDAVGFAPGGETIRYEYVLVEASADHFVAEARGKDEQKGDLWRIDETKVPINVANVCGGTSGDQAPASSTATD